MAEIIMRYVSDRMGWFTTGRRGFFRAATRSGSVLPVSLPIDRDWRVCRQETGEIQEAPLVRVDNKIDHLRFGNVKRKLQLLELQDSGTRYRSLTNV